MEIQQRKKLCQELSGIRLTKAQRAEFDNISKNQPVFDGNLLSASTYECRELKDLGLVMFYKDSDLSGWVLTDKGTVLKENLEAAIKLRDSGVLYKNQKHNNNQ